MKSPTQKTVVLSFILASAFAMPVIAQTDLPKSDMPAAPSSPKDSDQNKVTGKVTAKTKDAVTVDDQTINVSDITTVITKGGATVKLDDVKVGDKVNITTTRGLDGKLQAVKVEVVPAAD